MLTGLSLDLPLRHYLGTLDDRPVATSSFSLAAGVVGIQFVSTRPEARGRGLALGYRAGILQSSDMGCRVYERLGFKKVCDVENYLLESRWEVAESATSHR